MTRPPLMPSDDDRALGLGDGLPAAAAAAASAGTEGIGEDGVELGVAGAAARTVKP